MQLKHLAQHNSSANKSVGDEWKLLWPFIVCVIPPCSNVTRHFRPNNTYLLLYHSNLPHREKIIIIITLILWKNYHQLSSIFGTSHFNFIGSCSRKKLQILYTPGKILHHLTPSLQLNHTLLVVQHCNNPIRKRKGYEILSVVYNLNYEHFFFLPFLYEYIFTHA